MFLPTNVVYNNKDGYIIRVLYLVHMLNHAQCVLCVLISRSSGDTKEYGFNGPDQYGGKTSHTALITFLTSFISPYYRRSSASMAAAKLFFFYLFLPGFLIERVAS